MKKLINTLMKVAVCAMLLTVSAQAFGVTAKQIKQRMIARYPQIKAFLQKGIVGENNKGYLKLLKNDANAKKIVEAENNDRKIIYTAIAKQQNATPELVGKRRAIMIAKRASKGYMLQDAKGKWYKK